MSLILQFTYMLMSIDRSCHLHVTSSGSATSIVHVSDDNSQKSEDLPGETHQHWSASFRWTINTLPPLARTPRVLGMENSFIVKKECKGSQLVRTVSVLSKAHFLLQKGSKPPSCGTLSKTFYTPSILVESVNNYNHNSGVQIFIGLTW